MSLDILIVGHIVKDITVDGWRPGGSALYAAAQASRLGLRTGVYTSCDQDVRPDALLPDVEWRIQTADASTNFENTYRDGKREQRLVDRGPVLHTEDVPRAWRSAPIVFLAPVFHELGDEAPSSIANETQIIGLGAQGWLRRLDGARVLPGEFAPRPLWLQGDVVFVSEEDLSSPAFVETWQSRVRVVVLTRGRQGCSVWSGGQRNDFGAIETDEVDPTGAGDVFASAFLVRYAETREAETAAPFAAAAAALSVRAEGIDSIGGRDEIETLVRQTAAVRSR